MKTIEELISQHGIESEIVKDAIDEQQLYEKRIKGKSWEELVQGAKGWREVFKELGE